MNKNIKIIRTVILANHGGLQDASDHAILTVWNSLDADTQNRYLSAQQTEVIDPIKTRKDK